MVNSWRSRHLAIEDRGLREFIGGYSEYREAWRRENDARRGGRREGAAPARKAATRQGPVASRKAEERILARISELEGSLRSKQEACGLEENYRSSEAMRRLKSEIAGLEQELGTVYRKWEEISSAGPGD